MISAFYWESGHLVKAYDRNMNKGASEVVYGLGFVGALIYFLQHSTTLWMGVVGVFKAIVWPALLVYKVLGMLNF